MQHQNNQHVPNIIWPCVLHSYLLDRASTTSANSDKRIVFPLWLHPPRMSILDDCMVSWYPAL